MKTFLVATASIIIGTITFASIAYAAETHNFRKPRVVDSGNRLDLCLNWGSGCGKPAADAWCTTKGFTTSASHIVAYNIGAETKTQILATGAICDQNFCDGFQRIICKR